MHFLGPEGPAPAKNALTPLWREVYCTLCLNCACLFQVEGLRLLNRADPFVEVSVMESGEHVLGAAGEVHLETCIKDLQTRFARVELQVCVCVCRVCVGVMVCVVCFQTCRRALHEWSCRCVCLCVQGLCGCYGLCGVLLKRADALCTSGAAGVCLCVQGLLGVMVCVVCFRNVQTRFARVELQVCVCVCRVCVGVMVCVVCFQTCRRALHEWSCRCVFVCAGFVWVLWSVLCAFETCRRAVHEWSCRRVCVTVCVVCF